MSSRRSFSCSPRSSSSISRAAASHSAWVAAMRSSSSPNRRNVQHVALRLGQKQKLLVVLAVDVGQVGRQFLQQARRHRPAAQKRARFAAGQDFALHDQLAVLDIEARGLQQAADGRMVAHVEDARHAGARASPVRMASAEARPPSSSPSAPTTIDLPLPVSPVNRFSRSGSGCAAVRPRRSSLPPVPAALEAIIAGRRRPKRITIVWGRVSGSSQYSGRTEV